MTTIQIQPQKETRLEQPIYHHHDAASDTEIVFTRTFNAPRTLVWDVWTQCEHLKNWWGPAEWELPTCEMDLRDGGHWKYCMRGPMPDGETMESCGMATYQEIVAPEKLVYTDDFVDADFNPVEGMPQH